MPLISVEISNLRNIQSVKFQPSKQFNLILGENGSGKTSLLEAIYVLGMSKSFRSTKINPIIQHNQSAATVFATWIDQSLSADDDLQSVTSIGVERKRTNSQYRVKVNGEEIQNLSTLIKLLPIKVIHADSYLLLTGSSRYRRKYLDWGVFHMEHNFLAVWQKFQRCLKHRNELIKQKKNEALLSVWDVELVKLAESIDQYRKAYLQQLIPLVVQMIEKHTRLSNLKIIYQRGWPEDQDLIDVLKQKRESDFRYGSTQYGPHRANLEFKLEQGEAAAILSRGQQKIVVSLLNLAQGKLLKDDLGKQCLYLLDDLPAELDPVFQEALIEILHDLDSQVFITAIMATDNLIDSINNVTKQCNMFHMEQGVLTQV